MLGAAPRIFQQPSGREIQAAYPKGTPSRFLTDPLRPTIFASLFHESLSERQASHKAKHVLALMVEHALAPLCVEISSIQSSCVAAASTALEETSEILSNFDALLNDPAVAISRSDANKAALAADVLGALQVSGRTPEEVEKIFFLLKKLTESLSLRTEILEFRIIPSVAEAVAKMLFSGLLQGTEVVEKLMTLLLAVERVAFIRMKPVAIRSLSGLLLVYHKITNGDTMKLTRFLRQEILYTAITSTNTDVWRRVLQSLTGVVPTAPGTERRKRSRTPTQTETPPSAAEVPTTRQGEEGLQEEQESQQSYPQSYRALCDAQAAHSWLTTTILDVGLLLICEAAEVVHCARNQQTDAARQFWLPVASLPPGTEEADVAAGAARAWFTLEGTRIATEAQTAAAVSEWLVRLLRSVSPTEAQRRTWAIRILSVTPTALKMKGNIFRLLHFAVGLGNFGQMNDASRKRGVGSMGIWMPERPQTTEDNALKDSWRQVMDALDKSSTLCAVDSALTFVLKAGAKLKYDKDVKAAMPSLGCRSPSMQ